PEIRRQNLQRRIHEHAALFAGREFPAAIVDVVETLDAIDELPRLAGAHDGHGKADRVERHIVLSHELEVGDGFRRLAEPPVAPAFALAVRPGPFPRRADIFDRRIEPDVEYLALELSAGDVVGHRNAPFEIARNAAVVQPL